MLGQIIEVGVGQALRRVPEGSDLRPPRDARHGLRQLRDQFSRIAPRAIRRMFGLAPVNAMYIDMSIPHAAGALYSTVLDLLKWDRALDSEKLVSRKSLDAMFTPFKNGYGYGWAINRKFDQTRCTPTPAASRAS